MIAFENYFKVATLVSGGCVIAMKIGATTHLKVVFWHI